MKIIYFVIGTKAQFIKCKPVINYLSGFRKVGILVTNQHKDFIKMSLLELEDGVEIIDYLDNDVTLDSIFKNIKWFLKSIFQVFFNRTLKINRDSLIVNHGDTLSALLGVLIAKKNKVEAIHLEAGLRSGMMLKPFPEEVIRKIVSIFSKYLIADGTESLNNLKKHFGNKYNYTTSINTAYENISFDLLKSSQKISNEVLILMHRSENIYSRKRLTTFCNYVVRLSQDNQDLNFIWIMHPSTKKQLLKFNLFKNINQSIKVENLRNHSNFLQSLYNSTLFITDSLSAEFETYALNIKTVIWRNSFINRYSSDSFVYITHKKSFDASLLAGNKLIKLKNKLSTSSDYKPSEEIKKILEDIENL